MGERHTRSSSDFILGVPKGTTMKDVCKAYKSMVTRWYPEKSSPSKKPEEVIKVQSLKEAFEDSRHNVGGGGDHASTPDRIFTQNRAVDDQFYTPSLLSKVKSRRCNVPSPKSSPSSPLSRSMSRKSTITPVTNNSPGELPLMKSISRRSSTTPIMFSSSTARGKPPPVEKQLECTLEELLKGCTKKINITKDVITNTGLIVQEEEKLRIKVKPGWKRGTKITFEGMGDEKPGYLPADIIFVIAEKHHPLFRREENDLILIVEIPLIKALTGCTISIPLLGGEKKVLTLDEIVHPGYVKIIPGQGMPHPQEHGQRGDLRVTFQINFPTKLSDEQRSDVVNVLQDCDCS